ncbi:MAG: M14 family metallocarboxypeptidase [Verrucomicrobia bacterium]|nr:M14 family metallocarboxypeptidase [Verrucomicrobiota bacterium]
MHRLNRNHDGYRGETIDIRGVVEECVVSARAQGWCVEEIPAGPELKLIALLRRGSAPQTARNHRRVYLSTGIHGDEPAGPLATRHLVRENAWPEDLDLWICPCLNPTGFPLNRRGNARGLDLNRQYLQPTADETRAHIAWLQRQPSFDLTFCLHEDWEAHGFYLYELNPENRPSLAEAMIQRVAEVCPVDPSPVIEGRPANNGIIRPSTDPRSRPQWPEAFYLLTHKTAQSYTLEAPSDFPLATRVAALVAAVETLRQWPRPG